MKLQCCFPNCTNRRNDTRIYYFPNPVEKRALFEEWVNIIGGELLQMDYATIYENRFICGKHFQSLAMTKVFQKPVRTVKQRKRKGNSAKVNNSEPNRQIPNFETVNLVQDIKIEPETTLTMDAENARDNLENSDSENLPYITHVKSEALNSASDEDEMPWESALYENNVESELIIPDKCEIEQMEKIRDIYEPLIDIIETERSYESKMNWETDLNEKTAVSNTTIDKGSEINQINEGTEINEPLISNIKIENSCESEMIWDKDFDETTPNEPVIDKDIEIKQINEGTETTEPSIRVIKLGCDSDIITSDNQVSKDETSKIVKKVYIPINTVSKNDLDRNSYENETLQNGIDNVFLNERKETPGFSDKSTPMRITKVTSDRDTFRTTMKTQKLPTPLPSSTVKSFHSIKNIKHILDRLVQNLKFPKESTEALEMAHLANLVLLQYESMKEISSSYEIKNHVLENRLRSLQNQLRVNKSILNFIQKDTKNRPETGNVPYKAISKDMSPHFKDLFNMQMRLSTTSRRTFTTGEINFALELFKCSRKAYIYMSKTLILPDLNQIEAWASKELASNNTLKSDSSGYVNSMTKEDGVTNTEAIEPAEGESTTEIENLMSKRAIEKENNLTIKTNTVDDIDFEDKLDRDKWVIRKVGTKMCTTNDACVTDCTDTKLISNKSNQHELIKLCSTTLPQRKEDDSHDLMRSELNKAVRSSEQTITTESNDNYIFKGLLPTLKSNDQSHTNFNKYKEALNRMAVSDSEETMSACEDITDIKEIEKDKMKRVKLACRKLKIHLNKREIRNKSYDLKRAQTTTNRTNKVRCIERKRKNNVKRERANESGDATAVKSSKDNYGKKKRHTKDIVNEKSTVQNNTVQGSYVSRRHSSRLALKGTHNPQDELKT